MITLKIIIQLIWGNFKSESYRKQKNDNSIRDISKSFKINKDLETREIVDLININPKEKKYFNREAMIYQEEKITIILVWEIRKIIFKRQWKREREI